jgi:MSHA biogenesis protein MshN
MSLINQMLQDLDQRQALAPGLESAVVRPRGKPRSREWFWRTLAVLMLLSVAWVFWVAFQLMPRAVATDLALRAAERARQRAPAPVEQPAVQAPSESLKLAVEIQTPVRESPPKARPEAARPKPPAAEKPAPAAEKPTGSVDKRDRARSKSDVAEAHFRQAAVLLNQARLSEAEDQLIAALRADDAHVAARQAYVALLLEQQRIEVARRQLLEALAINPGQPAFTLALARIHVESRDYAAALNVMEQAGSSNKTADFQLLRGVILQRQARYGEAVEAYQNAIRGAPQPGATWLGLAISLERSGRRAEAAEAYRQALVAGQLSAEAREYAESRGRALQ